MQRTAVLLTRPEGQGEALARRVAALGFEAVELGLLRIAPLEDAAGLEAGLALLQHADLAVFVSPNAVRHVAARLGLSWPGPAIGIMGPGSAEAVRAAGWVAEIIAPDVSFDSEGLYAALQARGRAPRRVVIFRGTGGREWLRERLTADGAAVALVECYRRLPRALEADGARLRELRAQAVRSLLVLTSSEAARHLAAEAERLDLAEWLRGLKTFAPHPRIAETARVLGFRDVSVCEPGDDGIVRALESTR